jgi:hypothetical protein
MKLKVRIIRFHATDTHFKSELILRSRPRPRWPAAATPLKVEFISD